jgi:hypothetical protein
VALLAVHSSPRHFPERMRFNSSKGRSGEE